MFRDAGQTEDADELERDIVGRNAIDGRWSFQIVEEYDDLYHRAVTDAVRQLEAQHQGGVRHVFESRMKDDRRTSSRPGHERRPAAVHDRSIGDHPPEPG